MGHLKEDVLGPVLSLKPCVGAEDEHRDSDHDSDSSGSVKTNGVAGITSNIDSSDGAWNFCIMHFYSACLFFSDVALLHVVVATKEHCLQSQQTVLCLVESV